MPVSAKLNIGIADILMVLTGLAQKFLENEIKFSDESTRGTVIEVKKEGSLGTTLDTILYQGILARGDTIALNTANGPQTTKVKAILVNSSNKGIMEKDKVSAAAGIRILITDKLDVTPGTSIIKILDNPEQAFEELTRESKPNINVSENGVTIKAEALGSLEAVAYELDQNNIKIREASIGDITKRIL